MLKAIYYFTALWAKTAAPPRYGPLGLHSGFVYEYAAIFLHRANLYVPSAHRAKHTSNFGLALQSTVEQCAAFLNYGAYSDC